MNFLRSIILSCLFCLPSFAIQVSPDQVDPADIGVRCKTGNAMFAGSATRFYSDDKMSLILTAAHNVNHNGRVFVVDNSGAEHPAVIVALDSLEDVAVLSTKNTNQPYRLMSSSFSETDEIYALGWTDIGRTFFSEKGTYKYAYARPKHVSFTANVRQGQSGGAIVNKDGAIVGVVASANSEEMDRTGYGDVAGSCGKPLFGFVKKAMERRSLVMQGCRNGRCWQPAPQWVTPRQLPRAAQPVLVPTPRPNNQVSPKEKSIVRPNCDKCDERCKNLEKRISEVQESADKAVSKAEALAASLQQLTLEIENKVISGSPGKDGEDGQDGEDGKDAEITPELIQQITQSVVQQLERPAEKVDAASPVYWDLVPRK